MQIVSEQITHRHTAVPQSRAALRASGWGAVFALTLCVATLIASEFMPVSLLTPIAADLHMSEGRAGQAIAVSGILAVLSSLGISWATQGIDRRRVLLGLTLVMLVSGIIVALFGLGLAQREGGEIEEIRPGDVVWFAPGEKHWHGASPKTAMTHIAIQEALDGKAVEWLEHVSDEQYTSTRSHWL